MDDRKEFRATLDEKLQLLTDMEEPGARVQQHDDRSRENLQMTCCIIVCVYQSCKRRQNVPFLLFNSEEKSRKLEQPTLTGCRSTGPGTVRPICHTEAPDRQNSSILRPSKSRLQYRTPLQLHPTGRKTSDKAIYRRKRAVEGSSADPLQRMTTTQRGKR